MKTRFVLILMAITVAAIFSLPSSAERADFSMCSDQQGAAFGHDTNDVTIYSSIGKLLSTGLKSKREIADIILQTAYKEEAFQKILV